VTPACAVRLLNHHAYYCGGGQHVAHLDRSQPPEQENAKFPVKTLLHPTDLSEASRNAFDMACQIARDRGARVVVLHVVPPANRHSTEVVIGNPLAGFHEIARDVSIETRVEKDDPASAILRTAEDTKCDLIVMGTHGRTGLIHWLTGHVVDQVVQRAACAVLSMRSPFPEQRQLNA
jgi:nucleotide-binding universal stress UspA family protein